MLRTKAESQSSYQSAVHALLSGSIIKFNLGRLTSTVCTSPETLYTTWNLTGLSS
jgi:hypothetical protein